MADVFLKIQREKEEAKEKMSLIEKTLSAGNNSKV